MPTRTNKAHKVYLCEPVESVVLGKRPVHAQISFTETLGSRIIYQNLTTRLSLTTKKTISWTPTARKRNSTGNINNITTARVVICHELMVFRNRPGVPKCWIISEDTQPHIRTTSTDKYKRTNIMWSLCSILKIQKTGGLCTSFHNHPTMKA